MTPKLLAFDVEGILVEGNSWLRLHSCVGISPEENHKWLMSYYTHTLSFTKWADMVISRYRRSGKTKAELETAVAGIIIKPNVRKILTKLQAHYQVCLISGTVDFYVQKVARLLSINEWYATYSFTYDRQGRVNDITYLAPDAETKVLILKWLSLKKNLSPEEIVFVGDSDNDLEAFRFTKRGVLVGKGNEKLIKAAWKHVENLKEIEDILLD